MQNRVQRAIPRLPEEVRRIGVIAQKSSPSLTMVVSLVSPDGRYDELYQRNYAVLNIKNRLQRIEGSGLVDVFGGGDYAMRIWLQPPKLASYNLTATDVVMALREQNVQVAAGVLGAPPSGGHFAVPVERQRQGPPARRGRVRRSHRQDHARTARCG